MKNYIIHIEASDHLVTDETKRHKLALMLACALVLMLSIYPCSQINGLFGILKFTEGNEIQAYSLLPYALAVMFYQGVMYTYHYNESKKAWINKKLKSIKKDKIDIFNNLESNIISSKAITTATLEPFCLTKEIPTLRLLNELRDTVATLESRLDNKSNFNGINDTLFDISQKIQHISEIDHNLKYTEKDVWSYVQPTFYEISRSIKNIDFKEEFTWEKVKEIKSSIKIIENITAEIELVFIEKYNYYLQENYIRESNFNENIRNAIKQRDELIYTLNKTSFIESHAIFIYFHVPLIAFMVALIRGVYIVLEKIIL